MQDPTRTQAPRISPTELFGGEPRAGQRMDLRSQVPSLVINAVAPFVVYQVLTANGVGSAQALTAAAVFPVIGVAGVSRAPVAPTSSG